MNYNTPTHDELTTIATFQGQRKFGKEQIGVMVGIYNRIFNTRERATTCGSCVARIHKGLMDVYNRETSKL